MTSSSLGFRDSTSRPDVRRPVAPSTVRSFEVEGHPYSQSNDIMLRQVNVGMALLHTCLAVVTLAYTKDPNIDAPVFRVSINLTYTTDHDTNIERIRIDHSNGTVASLTDLFGIDILPLSQGLPIAWLTLCFFTITALAHAGAGLVYPETYLGFLRRKCNPLRWIEYSITATLMWLILAQAFALVEVNSLILSSAMIATTMASGMQCEYVARPRPNEDAWTVPLFERLAFLIPGSVLYGTAAATLCTSMMTNVQGSLPSFVVPTVVVQLFLFASFAGVVVWQQCHPPSRWIVGEYAFQVLSLCSKAVLGIVLIVNILLYEDYACIFDSASC